MVININDGTYYYRGLRVDHWMVMLVHDASVGRIIVVNNSWFIAVEEGYTVTFLDRDEENSSQVPRT